MKFVFVEESWEDYLYWQKTDKKTLKSYSGGQMRLDSFYR
ncbi:MAG: type II toxin-antitoxin system YoeB family toxin [Bacteroidetes bacterium]|nr:type II toxin-antitoxin system YoeB family toxin [Bacteroidota bacterium]